MTYKWENIITILVIISVFKQRYAKNAFNCAGNVHYLILKTNDISFIEFLEEQSFSKSWLFCRKLFNDAEILELITITGYSKLLY